MRDDDCFFGLHSFAHNTFLRAATHPDGAIPPFYLEFEGLFTLASAGGRRGGCRYSFYFEIYLYSDVTDLRSALFVISASEHRLSTSSAYASCNAFSGPNCAITRMESSA